MWFRKTRVLLLEALKVYCHWLSVGKLKNLRISKVLEAQRVVGKVEVNPTGVEVSLLLLFCILFCIFVWFWFCNFIKLSYNKFYDHFLQKERLSPVYSVKIICCSKQNYFSNGENKTELIVFEKSPFLRIEVDSAVARL